MKNTKSIKLQLCKLNIVDSSFMMQFPEALSAVTDKLINNIYRNSSIEILYFEIYEPNCITSILSAVFKHRISKNLSDSELEKLKVDILSNFNKSLDEYVIERFDEYRHDKYERQKACIG